MKAVLTRDFSIAPEGHTVFHYKAGEQITGKIAEIAITDGAAISIAEIAPLEKKIEHPEETKSRRLKQKDKA